MAEMKDTDSEASTIMVRIVPTIGLDYAARGVFPPARLKARPGRLPSACEVSVDRATAEAMLEDARERPSQLKREQPNCKGGVLNAWYKLVRDLTFDLLPLREQAKRAQANDQEYEANRRRIDWFWASVAGHGTWMEQSAREFFGRLPGEQAAALARLQRGVQRGALSRVPLEVFERVHEASLEACLNGRSWSEAGAVLSRIAETDILAVLGDSVVAKG